MAEGTERVRIRMTGTVGDASGLYGPGESVEVPVSLALALGAEPLEDAAVSEMVTLTRDEFEAAVGARLAQHQAGAQIAVSEAQTAALAHAETASQLQSEKDSLQAEVTALRTQMAAAQAPGRGRGDRRPEAGHARERD